MAPQNQSASANGGPRQGGAAPSFDVEAVLENASLSRYLLIACGSICVLLFAWRLITVVITRIRTIACLNNGTQQYFALASTKLSFFKRNLLYAPIFRKRHNREFQLSSAVNVGTLPTRLELLFLVGYLAINITFSVVSIPFSADDALAKFRDRTGALAVVNMIPLFLIAGRNNPLIIALNLPFDTFNLVHRFLGRLVILEAIAHSLAHLMLMAASQGWVGSFGTTFRVPYMMYGFLATCAFVGIALQAASPIRHAFYEVFKLIHIALVVLVIIGLWYHLQLANLPQLKLLGIIIPFWVLDRVFRVVRIIYSNLGKGGTKATIEALPGNACRVEVTLARPWAFRPGQHAYLYMPSVGFWQSHPFSVAWTREATDPASVVLPKTRHDDVVSATKTTISFVVRERTGFTHSLYKMAVASPNNQFVTRCFVEGPYGSSYSLHSYGTAILFAGGVGITHQVPYVRDLVAGYSNGTTATRKIVLIWVIQSPEHLEWIRPWMTAVLAMEKRREVLRIMLFISRPPRSRKEFFSPSATVRMFPGRPSVETLLGIEMEQQVGAMAVSVCGPGSLSDEVRRAVRNRLRTDNKTVDFGMLPGA